MRESLYDVAVIGGGIVGLSSAYQVLQRSPGRRVLVLEKEPAVGLHQSSHNSGVVHAGVYYTPGSLKARSCVRGKVLLEGFAEEHGVLLLRRGKLIVATSETEIEPLRTLAWRAEKNGVRDVQLLGPDVIREVEPAVSGVMALHSPGTAVADFGVVCNVLKRLICDEGGEVLTSAEVTAATETASAVRICSTAGEFQAKIALACGGLHADRLARMMGLHSAVTVAAIPGYWFEVRPEAAAAVRGSIYSVPDPRLPFLGVHLTRRLDGSVWAGPDAPATEPDARQAPDFRRRRALRNVQRLVPQFTLDDLQPGPIGVRAQAISADGSMVNDFLIDGTARTVHVLNAPSPAATASLALGEALAREAEGRIASAESPWRPQLMDETIVRNESHVG